MTKDEMTNSLINDRLEVAELVEEKIKADATEAEMRDALAAFCIDEENKE